VTVRRATAADARAIAEVHVRTWQAAYRHAFPAEVLDSLSVDDRERTWRQLLGRDELLTWVAEDGGRVVGFANVGPARDEEDVAELYAIYVLPESWGSGAGHELMRAAIDWFLAEEYTAAMLWVLADNPRARRFYEREGWRADGGRTDVFHGVEVEETCYRLTLVGS
jgi:GNAT superfamily N-acetyltransferase